MNRREALQRVAVLLGGAVSAPTIAGVLGGCRSAPEWDPAFLTGEMGELVASIAETIIPSTETPGAREAGVHRFIDRMLAEWYPDSYRQVFADGLAEVDRRAREAGASFVELESSRRREVLASMDAETFPAERIQSGGDSPLNESDDAYGAADSLSVVPGKLSADLSGKVHAAIETARQRVSARRPDGGPVVRADVANEGLLLGDPPPFMRLMKELTLLGYYTSEAGATTELKYEAVPGRWEACVPLADVGSAWAV